MLALNEGGFWVGLIGGWGGGGRVTLADGGCWIRRS